MPAHLDLDHLLVQGHVNKSDFRGRGGGRGKVRKVDRESHGARLLKQTRATFEAVDKARRDSGFEEALLDRGAKLVLEGADANAPLELDRLTRKPRGNEPGWSLSAVHPATAKEPERAVVWVPDEQRPEFLGLFEDYRAEPSGSGTPKNNAFVANIEKVRPPKVLDLWVSSGEPPQERGWWEVWLDLGRERPSFLDKVLESLGIEKLERQVKIGRSRVIWVNSSRSQMRDLLITDLPVTELREPSFIETIEDLSDEEQVDYVLDLADRVLAASSEAPAVCHLDTGVFRGHRLLVDSLASEDQHTVNGSDGQDHHGHGTTMAGLALYGSHLDDLLAGTQQIQLRHRLESVRILPGKQSALHPVAKKRDYATTTIQAIAQPEIVKPQRNRVFCMPVSASPDAGPGVPTLWSAAVDALAVGSTITSNGEVITLEAGPDSGASRLILVAAGNVDKYLADHLDVSDHSSIEEPGQAWNAVTVGAYTELDQVPESPDYRGYTVVAEAGELSPHSRTSVEFGPAPWPIKPEICLEGGNVLLDSTGLAEDKHPRLSLRSTGHVNDSDLRSANATSAATAQAARLAALAMERYPGYWPETIRGLLVREAEWTQAMRRRLDGCAAKNARLGLLRRYGWGVPTERSVLNSTANAVTMVVQDSFSLFAKDWTMPELRFHELPWPKEALQGLGETDVRLRITLSYFIEPAATRRGWEGKYTYRSHGLRFDLQGPTESVDEFRSRLGGQAHAEAEDTGSRDARSQRWFLGVRGQNHGSLHQDDWVGPAAELAACNHAAVYPVGGWWKNNRSSDRRNTLVRYALLVSLQTSAASVDLYTPIATQLGVAVPTVVEV